MGKIQAIIDMCSLIPGGIKPKKMREYLAKYETRTHVYYEDDKPVACLVMVPPHDLSDSVFILTGYCHPEYSSKKIVAQAIVDMENYKGECGAESIKAETSRFLFKGWKKYGFHIYSMIIERKK